MKTLLAIALASLVGSACGASLDTPSAPSGDVAVPDVPVTATDTGADTAPAADLPVMPS
jgi:hypothetical protein